MNQEEIKAKSAELAVFYTAKANGKVLEYDTKAIGWVDNGASSGPDMQSDLSRWRIKPEPQRIWISGTAWTDSPVIAAALREVGQEAREFVEVLP
jgi:hypothetical protein